MPTYFDTEVEQKLCLISDASLSIGQSRFVCAALITAHLTIRRKITAPKIDGTDVSKFGFKFAQSNASFCAVGAITITLSFSTGSCDDELSFLCDDVAMLL